MILQGRCPHLVLPIIACSWHLSRWMVPEPGSPLVSDSPQRQQHPTTLQMDSRVERQGPALWSWKMWTMSVTCMHAHTHTHAHMHTPLYRSLYCCSTAAISSPSGMYFAEAIQSRPRWGVYHVLPSTLSENGKGSRR